MPIVFPILLGLILFAPSAQALESGVIEVKVNGLQSRNGGVAAAVFDSSAPKAFPVEQGKAVASRYVDIQPDGDVIVRFEGLPHGHYAVSLFHDENGNKKLDTNFLGIPKEGMAASNDAKGRFGPPQFEDAKITLQEDLLRIEVEMEY